MFYRDNEIAKLPYSTQLDFFKEDYFLWYAYLIPYLEQMGHTVHLIIGNALPLQKAWANENDSTYERFTTIKEQIKNISPDILWVCGSAHYLGPFLKEIKDYCKKIITWVASSDGLSVDLTNVDCVLSSHDNFIDYFKQNGMLVKKMLPCFEPNIVKKINSKSVPIPIPVSFTGSLTANYFINRIDLVYYLSTRVPIQFWVDKPRFFKRPLPIINFLYQLKLQSLFKKIDAKPAVFGKDMFAILQSSLISLNIHGDAAMGLAGNIRMFEATGVGSLLMTENSPNLKSLFEPDYEVATYNSKSEAKEKINFYLTNSFEREAVAKKGQERTFQDHNPKTRANEFIEIVKSLI